jgi:hypothetical protein
MNRLAYLAVFWIFVVSCGAAAVAEDRCGAPLSKDRGMEYGNALTTLEVACIGTLSPKELLFTAGLSDALLEKCGLPRDINARRTLITFLSSTLWVTMIGREYLIIMTSACRPAREPSSGRFLPKS